MFFTNILKNEVTTDLDALNKMSNCSSLLIGHPLYLFFAKSMIDITLKLFIGGLSNKFFE